jgi:hypothetical protein
MSFNEDNELDYDMASHPKIAFDLYGMSFDLWTCERVMKFVRLEGVHWGATMSLPDDI